MEDEYNVKIKTKKNVHLKRNHDGSKWMMKTSWGWLHISAEYAKVLINEDK